MATRTRRQAPTQADLIEQHRIVKIDFFEGEHLKCVARVDMPEWNIQAGETFWLVKAGSYAGYYYIVSWDRVSWACRCPSVKPCKHQRYVNALLVEQYKAKQQAEVARRIDIDWREHVEDELRRERRKPASFTDAERTAFNYYELALGA